jgi:hypothetical protein
MTCQLLKGSGTNEATRNPAPSLPVANSGVTFLIGIGDHYNGKRLPIVMSGVVLCQEFADCCRVNAVVPPLYSCTVTIANLRAWGPIGANANYPFVASGRADSFGIDTPV